MNWAKGGRKGKILADRGCHFSNGLGFVVIGQVIVELMCRCKRTTSQIR